MNNNFTFFANKECPFYPCHQMPNNEPLNCLFCFCPLHHKKECLGTPQYLANGYKDCSQCTYPHHKHNYHSIINQLIEDSKA